jgi:hypothetical protein
MLSSRAQLRADLLSVTMLRPALYPIARRQLEHIRSKRQLDCGLGGRMLTAMLAYHSARVGEARTGCTDRAQSALDGDVLLDSGTGAFAYACRVLVAADRFTAAADAYERALAHGRRYGSVSAFALGMSFRGGLALYRGDARKLLARGLELADRCGARPLIKRARTELRVAGSPGRVAPACPASTRSPRASVASRPWPRRA